MADLGKAKEIEKDRFFEKPFNFYSSYIKLNHNTRDSIMEREIASYYKALAVERKDEVELKNNENEA